VPIFCGAIAISGGKHLCRKQKEEINMCNKSKLGRIAIPSLLVLGLMMIGSIPGYSQGKYETISAGAFGTSTQVGRLVEVTLVIYQFSTTEDRQILVEAFQKGQNQGLVNALSKMKAVGHINVTGTMGYDVSFIRMIPTPTGRKIRFVTNRKIAFGEARSDSKSMSFNLTAGEFDLNDKEMKKSTGTLYPATQLIINKEGELQFELNQNPWRLAGITDWKGGEEN
jgi:hypothetical protein